MKHLKTQKDFKKILNIKSEGFEYIVNKNIKPKPGDYAYLPPMYNDGKNGVILKLTTERTYPDSKEDDIDSYNNCWNVEVVNKSEIGKNHHDGKVHYAKSYHLSHFKSGGKVISTNNPTIII